MRLLPLLGLLTFTVARPAVAEPLEPDEPPIELPAPPLPPPGARAFEPEEPTAPAPPPPAEDAGLPSVPTAPTAPPPVPPASSDRPSATSPQRKPAGWYGWKVLIADGGALLLTVANAPLGPVLGAGAYVLTAPSIHLGHHRPLAALGSISLRIAAPLALNALVEKGPCGPDPCLGPGFFAGMALASLVDVTLLAHDSGEPTPKKTERVTPTVAAGPKSTALFLTGSF